MDVSLTSIIFALDGSELPLFRLLRMPAAPFPGLVVHTETQAWRVLSVSYDVEHEVYLAAVSPLEPEPMPVERAPRSLAELKDYAATAPEYTGWQPVTEPHLFLIR